MSDELNSTRRRFLLSTGALVSATACRLSAPGRVLGAPALIASEAQRPQLLQGFQIGDVRDDRALIWARADRSARLQVEWDTHESFSNSVVIRGPHALEDSDYTARLELTELPDDRDIFLRVSFRDLSSERIVSEPVTGKFRSAPIGRRNVRFQWSGDTAGQGFGINPEFGGMRIYETMRKRSPDFFIHSGDTIYADGPILAEVTVEDGKIWRNITTPEKSKVAETLAEFRGAYKYNLLDENVRRFNAEVPQIWQWDDHETLNNWSSSKDLSANAAYTEKSVALLNGRATRAFLEYAPIVSHGDDERERIYRTISYGPLLDVFVIDMRSYRGPNSTNLQTEESDETDFLGRPQLQWLKEDLLASRAKWKIIAADMPIGLQVGDGSDAAGNALWEAVANGDNGEAKGRELEIARLLSFIKHFKIENVVWLTADVHYTAAHYYDPSKAKFTDFEPFWEFVSGPLNAGTFGPNKTDDTFGLQVVYQKAPTTQNTSPFAGLQFFGEVEIDSNSGALTVTLRDLADNALFTKTLEPKDRGGRGGRGHGR
jgi:alkaline phosphatase D